MHEGLVRPDGLRLRGHYVTGWIKRGPSGVIGNNKADSVETANMLLADLDEGALLDPAEPDRARFASLLEQRQPRLVTFPDWQRLDQLEVERGRPHGRPRVKFTSIEEMLEKLRQD